MSVEVDDSSERLFWTGVGSRKAPHPAFLLGIRIGKLMRQYDLDHRGGDAVGMDKAFLIGMNDTSRSHAYSIRDKEGCINATRYERFDDAMAIAKSLHPNWKACGPDARKLHARNAFQILGTSLNDPSEFVAFWAPPAGPRTHEVIGGTNTAVKIAYEWDIPLFNTFYPQRFNDLLHYLGHFKKRT